MRDRSISIRVLMDNITSHPLMKDIPDETIVRYVVEFIRVMGCPYLMDDKTADIEIDDHRGALPCDFFDEVSVRGEHGEPFVTASGTFGEGDTPSYRIQGGVIHTSIPCGRVQLSYRAIEEDEDGYPLIPDDSISLRAMEAYVKKQWFTVLYDLGKINVSILLNAKQDYAWCAGQCHSHQHKVSVDKMEAIRRSLSTLHQRSNEHLRQFKGLSTPEAWRKH